MVSKEGVCLSTMKNPSEFIKLVMWKHCMLDNYFTTPPPYLRNQHDLANTKLPHANYGPWHKVLITHALYTMSHKQQCIPVSTAVGYLSQTHDTWFHWTGRSMLRLSQPAQRASSYASYFHYPDEIKGIYVSQHIVNTSLHSFTAVLLKPHGGSLVVSRTEEPQARQEEGYHPIVRETGGGEEHQRTSHPFNTRWHDVSLPHCHCVAHYKRPSSLVQPTLQGHRP